jgi:hypothetical protein
MHSNPGRNPGQQQPHPKAFERTGNQDRAKCGNRCTKSSYMAAVVRNRFQGCRRQRASSTASTSGALDNPRHRTMCTNSTTYTTSTQVGPPTKGSLGAYRSQRQSGLTALIRAGYGDRNGDKLLLTDKGRDALAQLRVQPGESGF